jgi:3'-5' exoribonuclease
MRIEHAILAHHGRQEWGSPVEPVTAEAYILHYADMLSVRFGPGLVL